jgi:hypothetical protein
MNKINVKKVIVEALVGFVLWTIFLSPYMIFVTGLTFGQFLRWMLMQMVISPPIAVMVVNVANRAVKRLGAQ